MQSLNTRITRALLLVYRAGDKGLPCGRVSLPMRGVLSSLGWVRHLPGDVIVVSEEGAREAENWYKNPHAEAAKQSK